MPDKKKPIPKTQAQLFKEQADAVATGAKPIAAVVRRFI